MKYVHKLIDIKISFLRSTSFKFNDFPIIGFIEFYL